MCDPGPIVPPRRRTRLGGGGPLQRVMGSDLESWTDREPLVGSARENLEPAAALDAIDREVPTVRGEHPVGVQLLREDYQRGIGIVHRQIGVLLHEGSGPAERRRRGRNQERTAGQEEVNTRLPASRYSTQKMRGFGQHGFGADDGPVPLPEELREHVMVLLAPVEQRDQSARIEQQFTGYGAETR